MAVVLDSSAPSPLDELPRLPRRNSVSILLTLAVQTLNSFNDNCIKMLFISLASAVAAGTDIGDKMQVYLGFIFSLPYILFAPLAGFLSDRFSKKTVVAWMQVAQVLSFGAFAAVLLLKDPHWSLVFSLISFFLLATQASIFSPAKLGIMKELAGSRRLGMVSGWLQMTMMAGILSGMWAGGTAFGHLLKSTNDPWHASMCLVIAAASLALLQCIGAVGIQATPPHPEVKFRRSLLWEHFAHLKLLFRDRPVRLAALGISFFWFLSNSMLTILVTMATEGHPGDSGEASEVRSLMAASLGVGIVFGSLFASWVCKRRIELGLVPIGGLGLAASLLWTGLLPVTSHWLYASLALLGFFGGCFMNPLYAYVQDRAVASERARILSGVNLMDCLAGVAAMVVVWLYLWLGMRSSMQVLTLIVPALGATIFITQLLPQQLARLCCLAIVRSIYKVKAIDPENVPSTGGVLLLPNHVTYVDALVLSAACDRPVRFVMWDTLYKVGWMNGFLRLFNTVPISPTRAKDAVRTVAAALKDGEVVCLFPEGQLARNGVINEIRRGFELMARQAEVPVLPVYMDGLWGSIFSFEGGKFFYKQPKHLRYPVSVHFGEAISGPEATASKVREKLLALGSQAFLMRRQFDGASHPHALANRMRLETLSLFGKGDTALVLDGRDSEIARSLTGLQSLNVVFGTAEAEAAPEGTVVAVGSAAQLRQASAWSGWSKKVKLAVCWQGEQDAAPANLGVPVLRGLLHTATGTLVSTEFPDPVMPKGDEELQKGTRPGTLGRLLSGLAACQEGENLIVSGLARGSTQSITLAGCVLDDQGFVTLRPRP